MTALKVCKTKDVETVFSVCNEHMYELTPFLKKSVHWDKVFSALTSYKVTYNERTLRMVKSDILGECIEFFSDFRLKYVNELGYDFFIPENNIKMEMKSSKDRIFSFRTGHTRLIKINNTNNQSSFGKQFKKTFDYLLIIDPERAGIISYEKLFPYVKSIGDGMVAKIPVKDIEIITEVSSSVDSDISLSDRYSEMIKQCVKDVSDNYDRFVQANV